ncbi:MAG: hypothetical protein K2Y37_06435 [Pirellulales bacterium]|nr:hypothetical protein [Pirellulales bacterium]
MLAGFVRVLITKPAVRWIVGLSLALIIALWWACQADVSPGMAQRGELAAWRRTVNGWEQRDAWQLGPAPRPPLHPVAVLALQLVAAIGLLVQHQELTAPGRAARR